MNKATISQLKNHLSGYLEKVKAGQPLLVMDRDRPIARIERVEPGGAEDDRLARLERAGLIRRGKGRIDLSMLAGGSPRRRRAKGAGLVEAVLEERREGR
ncbi:MAG TPA: type II toxin-antitoxin system prevent-host-death family antitoxin [Anaeromyxobacteraceae bacterium]|nr:type II toxin-antitoxin system prevent-host-death family antitoxin [Anaeromyxobacteraceae bacterium]